MSQISLLEKTISETSKTQQQQQQQKTNCTPAHLSVGSVHKSYHRSEPQVSGVGLGEIKKLPVTATGAPCKGKGRLKGVATTMNTPAWKNL